LKTVLLRVTKEMLTKVEEAENIGLYVHVPFCVHKCGYCNFASGSFTTLSQQSYVDALLKEITANPALKENKVVTLFMGGGTPSYLDKKVLQQLLEGLQVFRDSLQEWTVENNPGSLDEEKIKLYREMGVSRLSLGVQSFDEKELKFLERQHSAKKAHEAIDLCQKHYEGNWNADLIYALPGQEEKTWLHSIEEVLKHQPRHLSLYELTYEFDTPLGQQHKSGEIKSLSDELILRLQKSAVEKLSHSALKRYEISNYAQPGHECLHNLKIWSGMDFVGCGNGAHGRQKSRFLRNVASPMEYIKQINDKETAISEETEDKSPEERLSTLLILGLRSKEGVSYENLKMISNRQPREIWPELPDYLEEMLEFRGNSLICRGRAWEVLDELVLELSNKAVIF
jgi:oxygen-independent coproporphyrinogen-3 oxidase